MAIKFPARYRMFLFAMFMSFITTLIVSGVITYLNTATLAMFLEKWPYSFLFGWPIVFICILLVAPSVTRLVNSLVENKE